MRNAEKHVFERGGGLRPPLPPGCSLERLEDAKGSDLLRETLKSVFREFRLFQTNFKKIVKFILTIVTPISCSCSIV